MSKELIHSISREDLVKVCSESKSYRECFVKLNIKYTGHRFTLLKKRLNELNVLYNFDRPNLSFNKNVHSTIFNNIDTKEKAYWVGFISADGYVPSKNKSIRIDLSIKDEVLIDRFIKFINGDVEAKKKYKSKFGKEIVYFGFSNKEIRNSFIKLGIQSPKSNKSIFLDFKNEELDLAYLLGYYDGDGAASTPMLYSGSEEDLLKIKNKYNLVGQIKKQKNKWGSVCLLYIGIDLFKLMLNNYENSLPRKRKMLEYASQKNNCNCGSIKEKRADLCKKCFLNKK